MIKNRKLLRKSENNGPDRKVPVVCDLLTTFFLVKKFEYISNAPKGRKNS